MKGSHIAIFQSDVKQLRLFPSRRILEVTVSLEIKSYLPLKTEFLPQTPQQETIFLAFQYSEMGHSLPHKVVHFMFRHTWFSESSSSYWLKGRLVVGSAAAWGSLTSDLASLRRPPQVLAYWSFFSGSRIVTGQCPVLTGQCLFLVKYCECPFWCQVNLTRSPDFS